jgi:hypothetical protein
MNERTGRFAARGASGALARPPESARGCRRRGYPMLNLRSSAMRSRQQLSPGRGISPSSKPTNLRAERGLVLFRTGRSAARRAWAVVVGEAMPPRRG